MRNQRSQACMTNKDTGQASAVCKVTPVTACNDAVILTTRGRLASLLTCLLLVPEDVCVRLFPIKILYLQHPKPEV